MEPVDVHFSTPMRDPTGSAVRFVEYYAHEFNMLNAADLNVWQASGVLHSMKMRGVAMYSRGDAVLSLVKRLEDDQPCLHAQMRRTLEEESVGRTDRDRTMYGPVWTRNRRDLGYVALALLLLPDAKMVKGLLQLHNKRPEQRLYGVDLLLKAFDPDWALPKKYIRERTPWAAERWSDGVLRVMAAPASERSAALQQYMTRWCALMTPLGWKPVRDFSAEAAKKRGELESLFTDFAFEAALTACAYDIDDSGCRQHPYYPGDLVDYYRQHLRHSRDGWRADGVGAGLPVQAPPPPPRADLSKKSKRKGLARWIELASDGDIEATDAASAELGKPRKITDASELGRVLGEHGIGLCADLKDDDSVKSQLQQLAEQRGLDPAAVGKTIGSAIGVSGVEQMLQEAARWFAEHRYELRMLDTEDDAWHAVLVGSAYLAEADELARSLGIATSGAGPG